MRPIDMRAQVLPFQRFRKTQRDSAALQFCRVWRLRGARHILIACLSLHVLGSRVAGDPVHSVREPSLLVAELAHERAGETEPSGTPLAHQL